MGNPASWSRLVTRLQPGKLKSLAGGGQAPRGVLLCFDLESFTRPGASEAISNAARYLQAHQDLLANRVTRIHIKDRRGQFDSATHSEIDELSIIADECTIKPGAEIINSVLGRGCYIEERARIENSVIWSHTRIGTAARVEDAVIGRGCHIGRSTVVGSGAVLGDKTSLADYTTTCAV